MKNTIIEMSLRRLKEVTKKASFLWCTWDILKTSLKFLSMRLGRTHKAVRSSLRRCSIRKGVHKNFGNFTRKQLCRSLFLINLRRSIHRRCSVNKSVLRNSAIFPEKHLCQVLGLQLQLHRFFPVNFEKFLRIHFYRTPSNEYSGLAL